MRTARGLFSRLVDADRLDAAAHATVRGKRSRPDVAWFLFRRETVLRDLCDQLAAGTWRPAGFDLLAIHDPKPRIIARASIEDRVVHAALVRAMEPAFMPSLTDDAYACRPGFGTHRARRRLLALMRRHRFFVHLDIRSYFPSIDLEVLRELLAHRLLDDRFLAVLDRVLVSGAGLYDSPAKRQFVKMDADWPPPGRGLPIGAYTSQLFAAHVYLCELDHRIKRAMKVPGYVRYVDDLFLFADRRAHLRSAREEIGAYLADARHLRLKSPRARVRSCGGVLDGLGARITREAIAPRPRGLTRLRAQVARQVYRLPGERLPDVERFVASRVGDLLVPG